MEAELGAVRGALAIAAHVLVADPAQLGVQLVGRLIEVEAPGLVQLRRAALERATLWPLLPSLTAPGGPLLGTVSARAAASADPLGGKGTVEVHSIAVMPDGRTAVVGYRDGEVHAFDLETGVRLWAQGYDPDILSLAMDPLRDHVVCGSADGTVRILDAALGEDLGVLGRHDREVDKVAVSADGRAAVSGSLDGELRIWNLDDRSETGRLSVRGSFALAPDGRRLFGIVDEALRAWDLETLSCELVGPVDYESALAVAVTPDGERLVTVRHEVWEEGPGRVAIRVVLAVQALGGDEAPSTGMYSEAATGMYHPGWADLDVAADSSFAVSGSLGANALLWSLSEVDQPLLLSGHTTQVLAVAVTPNARRVLTGSRDGTVRIWDPARARHPSHVAAHPGEVNGTAVTPDGRRAVTVASDGSVAVWDLVPERAGRAVPWAEGPCWSVAVSDDGRLAVIGGSDGLVVVLDLDSGVQTARRTHPGGHVLQVGCSAAGTDVWAVAIDGTRVRWDAGAGAMVDGPAPTGGTPLFGLATTPDGSRALVGSPDGSVAIQSPGRAESAQPLGRHRTRVRSAALTPDGQRGVTGDAEGEIVVWDLEHLEALHSIAAHDGPVMALAVTPDSRLAASAGWDSRLALWDLERGTCLASLGTDGRLISVALSANGLLCVAGEQSGRVHAFRTAFAAEPAETGAGARAAAEVGRPRAASDLASTRAAAARGEQLLAGDPGNAEHAQSLALAYAALATHPAAEASSGRLGYAIRARDLLRGLQASGEGLAPEALETLGAMDGALAEASRSLGTRFEHAAIEPESLGDAEPSGLPLVHGIGGPVLAVEAMPDGKRVASAGADGTVRLLDLASGAEVGIMQGHDEAVFAVAATPDSRLVVSGSWDDTVRVWDATSGAELRVLRGHEEGVFALAVTPDGKHLVSGSGDRTLRVWELESGSLVHTWQGHDARVMAVAVAADGTLVVSGSEDGTLRLWSFDAGDARVLTGHESGVLAVALLPGGRRAVSGSFDQTIRIWDLDRGVSTVTLGGHYDAVRAVLVTPDGRRLVSAFFDGSIRIWDLGWCAEVGTLTGHAAAVTALDLLPDGRRVVSGSDDGTVRVWDLLLRGRGGELGDAVGGLSG